jgi:hypothetical protein
MGITGYHNATTQVSWVPLNYLGYTVCGTYDMIPEGKRPGLHSQAFVHLRGDVRVQSGQVLFTRRGVLVQETLYSHLSKKN